jgi:hypothetical protein
MPKDAQALKKFTEMYGIRRLIAVFTRVLAGLYPESDRFTLILSCFLSGLSCPISCYMLSGNENYMHNFVQNSGGRFWNPGVNGKTIKLEGAETSKWSHPKEVP